MRGWFAALILFGAWLRNSTRLPILYGRSMDVTRSQHYHAIVDMGSNGIRFSITDLTPPTQRVLPTLYHARAGISLYDAQWSSGSDSKRPIPQDVIAAVLQAYQGFKRVCEDFDVPKSQIRVLATEATREAVNSLEFRETITKHTGWTVEILPKEDEGRIGALGVASSFKDVEGLVMDLGGGSTQLTWLHVRQGIFDTGSNGSVSLPYGAAALSRRLSAAEKQGPASVASLRSEIERRVSEAYESIRPNKKPQLISLFLSGGGFRGWGYLLMDTHEIAPYPIPIINGFRVSTSAFLDMDHLKARAADEDGIFRVSERRASQVPAVAFLVHAVSRVLPEIKDVRFCQGGVREGALFADLPQEVRDMAPVVAATIPFAPTSASNILDHLRSAVPEVSSEQLFNILPAIANMLFAHSTLPKESSATAALRSTTSGILAGMHGLSHEERATLALVLCERWGGKLSATDKPFRSQLQSLSGPEISWWARYVGRVGAFVSCVYPAGVANQARVSIEARHDSSAITLRVRFLDRQLLHSESVQTSLERIEKIGKKKHWLEGKHGTKHGIKVVVQQLWD